MTKEIKVNGWTLVEYTPSLDRSLWAMFQDGRWVFRVDYGVDNILKLNNEDSIRTKNERFGEWRKVASVPIGHWHKALDEAATNDDDNYIRRHLNDPDNRKFRTFRNKS